MKVTGWEEAERLINAAHRRPPNVAPVAQVAETQPTEVEKRILAVHGVCSGCNRLGRTTSCPKQNPDCRFSPARTFAEIIGNLQAYQEYVKQTLEGR